MADGPGFSRPVDTGAGSPISRGQVFAGVTVLPGALLCISAETGAMPEREALTWLRPCDIIVSDSQRFDEPSEGRPMIPIWSGEGLKSRA